MLQRRLLRHRVLQELGGVPEENRRLAQGLLQEQGLGPLTRVLVTPTLEKE